MKTLLALSLALTTCLAHATSIMYGTPIQKGDYRIDGASARIVSVSPICGATPGEMTCMAIGSRVTLQVGLGGCLDSFGGYHHYFQIKGNKAVLHFGALSIANKASMTARCVRMPTVEVVVHTTFEGEIELKEMPFTASTLRQ